MVAHAFSPRQRGRRVSVSSKPVLIEFQNSQGHILRLFQSKICSAQREETLDLVQGCLLVTFDLLFWFLIIYFYLIALVFYLHVCLSV